MMNDMISVNTFPMIRGTRSVRTRLLNNCSAGTDTPTPEAMSLEIEKGT